MMAQESDGHLLTDKRQERTKGFDSSAYTNDLPFLRVRTHAGHAHLYDGLALMTTSDGRELWSLHIAPRSGKTTAELLAIQSEQGYWHRSEHGSNVDELTKRVFVSARTIGVMR